MNHKHVQVIMEDHDYCGDYDTWDVINDLIDYIECVERKTRQMNTIKNVLHRQSPPQL